MYRAMAATPNAIRLVSHTSFAASIPATRSAQFGRAPGAALALAAGFPVSFGLALLAPPGQFKIGTSPAVWTSNRRAERREEKTRAGRNRAAPVHWPGERLSHSPPAPGAYRKYRCRSGLTPDQIRGRFCASSIPWTGRRSAATSFRASATA